MRYITQVGSEFLAEAENWREAEDEAKAKVKKRVAKARGRVEKISPSQEGRRSGRAMHWAGMEHIRRTDWTSKNT